jgi:HD-GYP domain-containing protein (c-di-GMP phosphodiesterase class II)
MDLDYALQRIRSLAISKFDADVVAALENAVKTGRIRLTAALVEV